VRSWNSLSLAEVHLFSDSYVIEDVKSDAGRAQVSGRTLFATHNARSHFGDQYNIAEKIIISLPSVGDISFSKTFYQRIAPGEEESNEIYSVWNGELMNNDRKLVSNDASFVLLPSGGLFCNVKVGKRNFRCIPCSSVVKSSSCVSVIEVETSTKDVMQGIKSKLPNRAPNKNEGQHIHNIADFHDRALQEIDDGSVIDLLFLYTSAVSDYFGSDELTKAAIAMAVTELNQVYINSEIDLEARVVSMQSVGYVEDGDYKTSFNFLVSDDNIMLIRDTIGADLVSLVTMDDIYAYAYLTNGSLLDVYGFSLLGAKYLNGDYSLEVAYGYNFGCDYNYDNSLKDRMIAYAYGYQSENCDFHTILAFPCGDSQQILYYSTPNILWPDTDEPYGNADTADCTRVINESKLLVSQYRDSVEPTFSPTTTPTYTPTYTPTTLPSSIFSVLL
jgi:hypothetical protein